MVQTRANNPTIHMDQCHDHDASDLLGEVPTTLTGVHGYFK